MTDSQKTDIIENAGDFEGYAVVNLRDSNFLSEFTPMTIPTDKFVYWIQIYNSSDGPNGEPRKMIYAHYDWKKKPIWTLTDPFGIAWEDDWRAVDGTHYAYFSWTDYYNEIRNYRYETELAYAGSNGVGWDADIRNYYYNRGWGRIRIEHKNPRASGSAQVFSNYYHTWGTGSIGLTFGQLSVSFSGTRSHDSRGTYKTFTY